MIKSIAIVAGAVIAVPLVVAAFRPDTFRIERRATIKAPPEKVHALINDMRAMNTWNPFNLKDPNVRGEYRGPQAGPGAQYHYAGNREVGKGSLTIVETHPTRILMKLDVTEPMEGHNLVQFSLAPRGDATEVTWAIHGPSPYITKLVGLFMDMDKMIGREFESGLSMLKAKAEKAA
jgi:hypothetical protein